MPTYSYHCDNCNADLELFHSMTEPARTECPHCQQPSLRKVISAGAGIIFKGSGFYQTDYKQSKPGNDSSSSKNNSDNKQSCKDKSACACAAKAA